jgi:hypothetical protein
MQNIHHYDLMNVDEKMTSDEIDHVMNLILVSEFYQLDSLSLNLSLHKFMSAQRSLIYQILSVFRRYVTDDAMLFAFDVND